MVRGGWPALTFVSSGYDTAVRERAWARAHPDPPDRLTPHGGTWRQLTAPRSRRTSLPKTVPATPDRADRRSRCSIQASRPLSCSHFREQAGSPVSALAGSPHRGALAHFPSVFRARVISLQVASPSPRAGRALTYVS